MGQAAGPFKARRGERFMAGIAQKIIAVIIPAFGAEDLIGEAAKSLLAQDYPHWQAHVVSDDGLDYEALLGRAGLADPRFRFLSSGRIGGGASRARNLALDAMDARYAAILDADDRFAPGKLAAVAEALDAHAVVSSALAVLDGHYRLLRHVGVGEDRLLLASRYKFTCLSMDSMIAWDRRRTDARYDLELTNMTDLELLLQLWAKAEGTFHLGRPLHDYVKLARSMSNGPGVTEKMIRAKSVLLDRLAAGRYPMRDPKGAEGVARFLALSLKAEADYGEALKAEPAKLFEDQIEPLLRAASTSRA
jgi:glycosyltransferase involved in cell wall biosynthesis